MFKLTAGIDIIHIPYKGPAAAVTDLLAGQVQMYSKTSVFCFHILKREN